MAWQTVEVRATPTTDPKPENETVGKLKAAPWICFSGRERHGDDLLMLGASASATSKPRRVRAKRAAGRRDRPIYRTRYICGFSDLLVCSFPVTGDLKRTRAVILADMIGQKDLQVPPEANSTKWLMDLVWNTADRLGYKSVFVRNEIGGMIVDHGPFLKRGVSAVDIIDYEGYAPGSAMPYWHTAQDTMDKLAPKSFAIVGHVILESIYELQSKFK